MCLIQGFILLLFSFYSNNFLEMPLTNQMLVDILRNLDNRHLLLLLPNAMADPNTMLSSAIIRRAFELVILFN